MSAKPKKEERTLPIGVQRAYRNGEAVWMLAPDWEAACGDNGDSHGEVASYSVRHDLSLVDAAASMGYRLLTREEVAACAHNAERWSDTRHADDPRERRSVPDKYRRVIVAEFHREGAISTGARWDVSMVSRWAVQS